MGCQLRAGVQCASHALVERAAGRGREVEVDNRRPRPDRWVVVSHTLQHQDYSSRLDGRTANGVPQHPPSEKPAIELHELARIGAVDRDPSEVGYRRRWDISHTTP